MEDELATASTFLIDNGSIRPEATLGLRRLAAALSLRCGIPVAPVSVLHSAKVDPAQLGGKAAETLEDAIRRRARSGIATFNLLPLFFGPSRAFADFAPFVVDALRFEFPGLSASIREPLVTRDGVGADAIAAIMEDLVRQTICENGLHRPGVIMVDHGTPIRPVNAVRETVGKCLAERLSDVASAFCTASMERRPDKRYDFNEPLLETALRFPSFCGRPCVVSLLFASSGKHAGPQGDIASICSAACDLDPDLRTFMTPVIGEHPGLIDLLASRLQPAQARQR